MDANKIKFVDDDGTVEVLEPPMTARIHVENPTRPETPYIEGIQEEESSMQGLTEEQVTEELQELQRFIEDTGSAITLVLEQQRCDVSSVEGIQEEESLVQGLTEEQVTEELQTLQRFIEGSAIALEQQRCDVSSVEDIKDNVLQQAAVPSLPDLDHTIAQGVPDVIKMDEVKVPEQEYKETLSLVANTVQHASEHKPITPKGCCILQ